MSPRFVVPGGLMPNSVDPLDLDQFANYFPGQMIYLPPLQADLAGKLTSHLLSDFHYDEKTSVITLKLGHWTYSDGTSVTIDDVALAIKRMTLARSSFPVIRFIDGVSEWLKVPHPLTTMPKGMRIDGETLTIKLNQKVYHPLFRFSLNIFAVIPSSCIDLKTSKLSCPLPPSSGYYLSGQKSGTQIEYKLRTDLSKAVAGEHLPETIVFEFSNKPVQDLVKDPAYDSVAFGYDLNFTPVQYKELESEFRIERLPSSWFSGFIFNPHVKPFDDRECRGWFARKFREAFASQDLGVIKPSSSVFSSIIPGYKTDQELGSKNPFTLTIEEKCLNALRGQDFVFAIKSQTTPPFVQHALTKLSTELKFKIAEPVVTSSKESRRNVSMQLSNSGFWALDPVGDVQMLLAPNMHDDYANISGDSTVQALLKEISSAMTPEAISSSMGRLNTYLVEEGLLNVFSNQGYFYLSSKQRPKRQGAAFSITVPYPWQVF